MTAKDILRVPDTPLAREAKQIMVAALPQPLLNHSLRSYLLAKAYAGKKKLNYDEEGLYIAALFHDLGLCAKEVNPRLPFQINSSLAMAAFLEESGIPKERISPLVDAIDFHCQFFPRWSSGHEVGLLQVGTWMDLTLRKRLSVWKEAHIISQQFRRKGVDWLFPWLVIQSMRSLPACAGILWPRKYRPAFG